MKGAVQDSLDDFELSTGWPADFKIQFDIYRKQNYVRTSHWKNLLLTDV